MSVNYVKYIVTGPEAHLEPIMALLINMAPFDSFEEKKESLEGYLPANQRSPELDNRIAELLARFNSKLSVEEVPDQNWNARWEASFTPVDVGKFCRVRADFHPATENVKYDVVINPKMSFGTGHHETTYMMIKMMEGLFMKKTKVLDYGCGTGVLAILASKMGAQTVDAVDIEEQAFYNAIENNQLNNVFNVQVFKGNLNAIADTEYDVILANINRNVILNSLAALREKLNKRGCLIISGVLKEDESLIMQAISDNRFTVDEKEEKGDWLCMKLWY